MHWSLEQVRDLDVEEYRELLTWAQDKGKDPDSVDMDEVVAAKNAKKEAE
jgi:hypothetical protein